MGRRGSPVAITVADAGLTVLALLNVEREAEGRYRYQLRHAGQLVGAGVGPDIGSAQEMGLRDLLVWLRSRGVELPVVTVLAGGRRYRLRLRKGEGVAYSCAVVELTERDLTRRAIGQTDEVGGRRSALLLGFRLALAEAGLTGDAAGA